MVDKLKPGASWRTTTAGIAAAVAAIASAIAAGIDGDPSTHVDVSKLLETLSVIGAALGLIAARDNVVTSEQAGAK